MNQSNALHAFVLQQVVPVQLAAEMSKAHLRLREQTQRSVYHEQKAPVEKAVDQDQNL